ncbi:uncharacterized protein [Halyomorpha halys]|uniref:uncharacterized protein n=1 Tax=Halyomorpha halys TaxID=286706 RepID=UPI0006D5182E|nr:uncharacterized protein LOC106681887 [Halyomorpha halys]
MSETKLVPDIEEFEIEEEEGYEGLEEDLFAELFADELQTEEEEVTEESYEKLESEQKLSETFQLDDEAVAEINICQDPSYTNVNFPYYLICEKRLAERMKQFRMLLKCEVEKITAEQTSAFESVSIRRLYKTGMGLPERIFVPHENDYTFKERERLRYLLNNEVV